MFKHLHGRGEDAVRAGTQFPRVETPSRTWRRLQAENNSLLVFGNTSTDVEKTLRCDVGNTVSVKVLQKIQ